MPLFDSNMGEMSGNEKRGLGNDMLQWFPATHGHCGSWSVPEPLRHQAAPICFYSYRCSMKTKLQTRSLLELDNCTVNTVSDFIGKGYFSRVNAG